MLPAVHLVVSGLVGVVVVIMQLSIHRIDEGHVSLPPSFHLHAQAFKQKKPGASKTQSPLASSVMTHRRAAWRIRSGTICLGHVETPTHLVRIADYILHRKSESKTSLFCRWACTTLEGPSFRCVLISERTQENARSHAHAHMREGMHTRSLALSLADTCYHVNHKVRECSLT
jgi:hypothetical protein